MAEDIDDGIVLVTQTESHEKRCVLCKMPKTFQVRLDNGTIRPFPGGPWRRWGSGVAHQTCIRVHARLPRA